MGRFRTQLRRTSRHMTSRGQVEPDHRLRALEDEVADIAVVVPSLIQSSAPRWRGLDPVAQHLGRRLLPVGAVPERVDLDGRDASSTASRAQGSSCRCTSGPMTRCGSQAELAARDDDGGAADLDLLRRARDRVQRRRAGRSRRPGGSRSRRRGRSGRAGRGGARAGLRPSRSRDPRARRGRGRRRAPSSWSPSRAKQNVP